MKTIPAGVTRHKEGSQWVYVVRREPETVYELHEIASLNAPFASTYGFGICACCGQRLTNNALGGFGLGGLASSLFGGFGT